MRRSRGWSLLNGISVLVKEAPENSAVPGEGGRSKKTVVRDPGRKQCLTRLWMCQCLDLEFLSLQIYEKSFSAFCNRSPSRLRHQPIPFPWAQKPHEQCVCPLIWEQTTRGLLHSGNAAGLRTPIQWLTAALKRGIVCRQSWGIHFSIKRKRGNFETTLLCACWTEPRPSPHPGRDWPHPVSRAGPDPLGAVRCFYLHVVTDVLSDGAWSEWSILSLGTQSQQCSCRALGLPCLQGRWGHHTPPSGISLPLVDSGSWRASDKIEVKQKQRGQVLRRSIIFRDCR